ncbi:hypothetical protein, partial [Klebsiella pneumoniae]|uniref:hypothetical protein n=1 Tax=Klebsiella pneumoniae TaxID=573 RepID=UPI0037471AE2
MNLHKILTITATFYAVERNREESLHSVAGKLSAYALRLCGCRECLPALRDLLARVKEIPSRPVLYTIQPAALAGAKYVAPYVNRV